MSFIGMNNKCKDCPKCTKSAMNGANCIGSWTIECENFAPPKRIQRKRTKGWKMPPNTVYVGRPSTWGNPFLGIDEVKRYEERIMYKLLDEESIREKLNELKGKNLACWCPLDKPCHADVLLEIANGGRL